METYICPECKSNELQYDKFWNDGSYICSDCGLENLYLEDLKTESEEINDKKRIY